LGVLKWADSFRGERVQGNAPFGGSPLLITQRRSVPEITCNERCSPRTGCICVCVCLYVHAFVCVCECVHQCMCMSVSVCVCVCVREREKERERESVCVCVFERE